MKTFIKIYKAVLLYSTVLSCTFTLCALESIIEQHNWAFLTALLLLCIGGVFTCYNILSYRDVYKLSGTYYFDQLLK